MSNHYNHDLVIKSWLGFVWEQNKTKYDLGSSSILVFNCIISHLKIKLSPYYIMSLANQCLEQIILFKYLK